MKKRLTIILTLVLSLLICIPVFAESAESAGNLFLADEEVYKNLDNDGDIYTAGSKIELRGNIKGDVIAAGESIILNDLSVLGNIRTASATLNINSKNIKNITSVAGEIIIGKDTIAKGIYIGGGAIEFLGTTEDFYASGEDIIINGIVNGDVKVDGGTVTFGENAKVLGNIKITAKNEPIIKGDIDKDKIEFKKIKTKEGASVKTQIINKVLSLATALLMGLLSLVLFKNFFVKGQERLKVKTWLPILLGFVTLIALPISAALTFVTIIGIPLGFISLIVYGIIIYLAPVISGIIIGQYILPNKDMMLSGFVGVILVKVLTFIPYGIGFIVSLAAIFIALGLFVMNIEDNISNSNAKA